MIERLKDLRMSVVCHNKILNAELAKIFFIYLPFEVRKGISFSKVHRGFIIIINYGYTLKD